MGILTAKYERRIHDLEMQVDDLAQQLAGERTMRRYEVAERDERIARMMANGGGSAIPYFVVQALESLDSVKPEAYIYFQDAIARIPPFRRVEVKLRKQTRANVPEGWEVERGGVVVLHDGEMIGKLPPEKVEKHGLSTSRKQHVFVIPPCVDADDGFRINDNYVPYLLL